MSTVCGWQIFRDWSVFRERMSTLRRCRKVLSFRRVSLLHCRGRFERIERQDGKSPLLSEHFQHRGSRRLYKLRKRPQPGWFAIVHVLWAREVLQRRRYDHPRSMLQLSFKPIFGVRFPNQRRLPGLHRCWQVLFLRCRVLLHRKCRI